MIKILDCTLRDGGYYTNWDFDKPLVDIYMKSMDKNPVDYIEVGYRSLSMDTYYGKYFYCPAYELKDLRKKTSKKLAIILNEKDVRLDHIDKLLAPIEGIVDMVRIAIDPKHIDRAIDLTKKIKQYDFEVGFNVMYMSKWREYKGFYEQLNQIDGLVDYFYMVDSYGGVYPDDVINTINTIRQYTKCPLGFHGHNNLELALINSLTAMQHGVSILDATICGMGRGAGNLKTELLLTTLNTKHSLEVNFNALGQAVSAFDGLIQKYQWGTNLPYMISGANSLPQKDVMDWVTTRFYSFNSIIMALQNQKNKMEDNMSLPKFVAPKVKNVVIIGGGNSAKEHAQGIIEFINKQEQNEVLIIHASSKNAAAYKTLNCRQIYCLVGNEGYRLEKIFNNWGNFEGTTVLPPYPRKMGTYVPVSIINSAYELPSVDFTNKHTDSHTALALQTALLTNSETVYLVGYDGYHDKPISQKEYDLTLENEFLFDKFNNKFNGVFTSLTPSQYNNISTQSLYSFL